MTDITTSTVATDHLGQPRTARPLRIVIPGGEGHLGRLLSGYFAGRGHSVATLTRDPAKSRKTARDLASRQIVFWDGRSLGAWVETLEQADVVINLAGRSVDCRYSAKNRREILRSRVDSTAVLGEAFQMMARPPRVWLNASTATIYRHSLDRQMDEFSGELGGNEADTPESWRFSIDVARQWEESFFSSQTPGTRKIAMRAAMVMSSEPGGPFGAIFRLVRMGLGGRWGSGKQYMSWIHESDFVRAVEFLIEREDIQGAVNLAAPNPIRNDEFMSNVRAGWGAAFGLPATEWMLEVGALAMRTETELLLKSRRVVPGVLQKHGFEFLYPWWHDAALDLVKKWRARNLARKNEE